jgi:DNA-binding transcriptional regulator YiaG
MEEEMKARVFLNGLSAVLVALVLSTCGGSPAPVSTPSVAQADPSPVSRADSAPVSQEESPPVTQADPQPVSAPVSQTVSLPDDLDAVIREASDYLNGKVPKGSKAVFLREVSDESAQSIGQMLGAQSIVSGTVSRIGDLYRLRVRALNIDELSRSNVTGLMSLYPVNQGALIKPEPLREFLSANIKARRETLGISQEQLAELADVSIQMVKAIEGRQAWG